MQMHPFEVSEKKKGKEKRPERSARFIIIIAEWRTSGIISIIIIIIIEQCREPRAESRERKKKNIIREKDFNIF